MRGCIAASRRPTLLVALLTFASVNTLCGGESVAGPALTTTPLPHHEPQSTTHAHEATMAAHTHAHINRHVLRSAGPPPPIPDARLDCDLRHLVLEAAVARVGSAKGRAASVYDALRLTECAGSVRPESSPGPTTTTPHHTMANQARDHGKAGTAVDEIQVFVSPTGSDSNPGTEAQPLRTAQGGRDAIRKKRALLRQLHNNTAASSAALTPAAVLFRAGMYHFGEAGGTLDLTAEDSNTVYRPSAPEERVVFTGAVSRTLSLKPVEATTNDKDSVSHAVPGACVAELEWPTNQPDIDLMFDTDTGANYVWAREPNGNPFHDLQPTGYALANGNINGSLPDRSPGRHREIDHPPRNSTVYPVWGKDYDPRGPAVWYTEGGAGSRFSGNATFWNGTVSAGLRWNATGGVTQHGYNVSGFRAGKCTSPKGAVLHAFQRAYWGNQQWRVESVDEHTKTLKFSEGGWQVGRPLGIGQQPFYVEGVASALDMRGEFFFNRTTQKMFVLPNRTGCQGTLPVIIPTVATLVNVHGASDVRIDSIEFKYTARTIMERYAVPSPGDWAIYRGGTVMFADSINGEIQSCVFNRTGSNAIFLGDKAKHTVIEDTDFIHIGDSAIATVGQLDLNNGTEGNVPQGTVIRRNHIMEVGVWGKQTSALFSAVSCNTTFVDNVAYNGPRAGININDGFCGGHNISSNVLFNWVRETQDHGPINTWDREMTWRVNKDGVKTQFPDWNHLQGNIIMNGPSGNRDLGNLFPCVDNDDGSAYYFISKNVCVYGGMKNYLGQDKVWDQNLIVYPGRWSGDPCLCAWGGMNNRYTDNICVSNNTSPLMLDGSISGIHGCKLDFANTTLMSHVAHVQGNSYYIGANPINFTLPCGKHNWTWSQLQAHGLEEGSELHDRIADGTILSRARELLGLSE
eukprot:m.101630 g.101630  ORF g.101630 m.101630 type:complete len:913 (-) comp10400_c0_seq1:76-2814(-)